MIWEINFFISLEECKKERFSEKILEAISIVREFLKQKGPVMNRKRVVVCAAIKHKETESIICGPRHFDKIMRDQIGSKDSNNKWYSADQGFVDQQGNFLTREEALIVALEAGQCVEPGRILVSEDLY